MFIEYTVALNGNYEGNLACLQCITSCIMQ